MSRPLGAHLALVFAFLYAPILMLMVLSFTGFLLAVLLR